MERSASCDTSCRSRESNVHSSPPSQARQLRSTLPGRRRRMRHHQCIGSRDRVMEPLHQARQEDADRFQRHHIRSHDTTPDQLSHVFSGTAIHIAGTWISDAGLNQLVDVLAAYNAVNDPDSAQKWVGRPRWSITTTRRRTSRGLSAAARVRTSSRVSPDPRPATSRRRDGPPPCRLWLPELSLPGRRPRSSWSN